MRAHRITSSLTNPWSCHCPPICRKAMLKSSSSSQRRSPTPAPFPPCVNSTTGSINSRPALAARRKWAARSKKNALSGIEHAASPSRCLRGDLLRRAPSDTLPTRESRSPGAKTSRPYSDLTRMECRDLPLRRQDQQLLARYDSFFGLPGSGHVAIEPPCLISPRICAPSTVSRPQTPRTWPRPSTPAATSSGLGMPAWPRLLLGGLP